MKKKLDFDGGITILTGAADIGQGSNTLLTQVVAEVLLLPMGPGSRIRVVSADSALTPKDNGSYSSRVSFMVGNAALRAAEALKRVLVEAAARELKVDAVAIEWRGERCVVAGDGDRGMDFAQCVRAALADSGTLTVKGTWSTPPETQGGKFRGAAVGSTAGFSYGAQVVEVEVDENTGAVRVLHCWVASARSRSSVARSAGLPRGGCSLSAFTEREPPRSALKEGSNTPRKHVGRVDAAQRTRVITLKSRKNRHGERLGVL